MSGLLLYYKGILYEGILIVIKSKYIYLVLKNQIKD